MTREMTRQLEKSEQQDKVFVNLLKDIGQGIVEQSQDQPLRSIAVNRNCIYLESKEKEYR